MTETEHLYLRLSEECIEVSKDLHKLLAYTPEDRVTYDPEGPRGTEGPTNLERVVEELNDLLGTTLLLVQRGLLPAEWQDPGKQDAKVAKILRYVPYARRVGAIQDAPGI